MSENNIEEETQELVEQKKKKSPRMRTKPPLKLCFKQKIDPGRSNIVPFRPKTYVHYVTRKFYTPDYTQPSQEIIEKVKKEYNCSPKQKYGYPVLESHRYGWYSDIRFQDPDTRRDKRINFHKSIDPLFSVPFFVVKL